MAADLDRAGQYRCRPGRSHSGRAGIPAGRAALLRGPGVHLQAGTPAGPGVLLLIREEVPAGLGEDFIVLRIFWD